jgi:hypothetical protein
LDLKESKCGSVRTLLGLIPDVIDGDYELLFRGHANKSFQVAPSIYRKPQWFSNEDKMIREILMRCPGDFSSMSTSFEKLVKMQHYDLPTRLLDLTGNPLVALYFACVGEDEKDNDGEILFFKIPKSEIKYFDSDTVSVVSNLAWAKSDFEIKERFKHDEKAFHNGKNIHALKLMHDIRQEKPHFLEKINPQHLESVLCVKPKLDNPRVIRQDGAFLLFGIEENKFSPAKVSQEWRHYPNQKKHIIKANDKVAILRQLSSIGISKAQLFPEIDMVSQFIKNDYGLNEEEFRSSIKDYSPANVKISFL